MKPRNDLTGKVFGKLSVLRFTGHRAEGKYTYCWECLCSCGNTQTVLTGHLMSRAITDCGCGKRTRGGYSTHPLFRVWSNMLGRCTDPGNKAFINYGGRGITISAEWMEPAAFIIDMGERPEGYTLERVDNDGPYSRGNCVWADRTTQANNKRNVPLIDFNGQSKSVAQWSKIYGLPAETLRSRLKVGWPMSSATAKFLPASR